MHLVKPLLTLLIRHKTKELLMRYIRLRGEENDEREAFLRNRLHVPLEWIAEAKSVRAIEERNFRDQAWYLIQARQYNRAHQILTSKIAPEAIVNEDYDFLFALLNELSELRADNDLVEIENWQNGGSVFLDFISVDREIRDRVLAHGEVDRIDRLRPLVTGLCSRISLLRTETPLERLCQSEIAKRTAHFVRAVMSVGAAGTSAAAVMAQQLSSLPLPDDYALQELRTLTRTYMMEIMQT